MSDPNSWAPNTEQFELGDGEAHVWRAHLNCDEAVLHRLEATLTSDEKARASCFHFPRDRNSFVAARGVLRELLGRYLGRAPVIMEFDYAPQGKPSLRAEFHERFVRFTASDSQILASFASAVGRNVVPDVELVR